jgi:hypothetical protein
MTLVGEVVLVLRLQLLQKARKEVEEAEVRIGSGVKSHAWILEKRRMMYSTVVSSHINPN